MLKANNHWFATYYTYYKDKLKMKKLTYDLYLFNKSWLLKIMEMQTDNILIFWLIITLLIMKKKQLK